MSMVCISILLKPNVHQCTLARFWHFVPDKSQGHGEVVVGWCR